MTKQHVGQIRREAAYQHDCQRLRDAIDAFKTGVRLDDEGVQDDSSESKNLRRLNEMSDPQLKELILQWANRPSHKFPIKNVLNGKVYDSGDEYGLAVWAKILESVRERGVRAYPRELVFGEEGEDFVG